LTLSCSSPQTDFKWMQAESYCIFIFYQTTIFFRQVYRNPLCMMWTVICTSLKFTPFPHKIKNTEYLKAYYAVTFHTRGQLLGIEVYPLIDRQLNWQLKHAFAKIVLCYFIFIIFLCWKIAHPEHLLDKEIKSFSKKYLIIWGSQEVWNG